MSEMSNQIQDPRTQRLSGIREWASPSAWTERMLDALGQPGAEERRWHALMDKVIKPSVIEEASAKVISNQGAAGVDRVSVTHYASQKAHHNAHLIRALQSGEYKAAEIRRVDIPKPGTSETRPLGIPTVRDRIMQTALVNVLEPIFDIEFSDRSYGFRRGRGCKDALKEVNRLLDAGHLYIVDADIKGYFNTIPHGKLLKQVNRKIADGKVLKLIQQCLERGVLEEMSDADTPQGTPQGGVISPLLANIYLNPLDHLLEKHGYQPVRYADDFVIPCKTQEEAEKALDIVKAWMNEAQLRLHPEKTKVSNLSEKGGYFDFLGYRFQKCQDRIQKWPRPKSMMKLKEQVRSMTRKNHGESLPVICANLKTVMKGWYGYFKHSNHNTFTAVDGYVRQRLRSILRKRTRRKGTARPNGADMSRWPNIFFQEQGYWSLAKAHVQERQSLRGTH